MGCMVTCSPYKYDFFIVKQYGDNVGKIICCDSVRESGWEECGDREHKKKCSANGEKLNNNLSRARSTIKELALCNPWDYFVTFTIDKSKHDRFNLDEYIKAVSEFIHTYNKRLPDEYKVKYLLVPEKHKNGAWHMHGFVKGIAPKDLYTNSYGYLTWRQYEEKFGFISMDVIRDKERAASYIQKYIAKDLDNNVTELNRHLYYCSKGLERADVIYRGNAVFHGKWDWEHPDGYCKIKNVDLRKEDIGEFLEMV